MLFSTPLLVKPEKEKPEQNYSRKTEQQVYLQQTAEDPESRKHSIPFARALYMPQIYTSQDIFHKSSNSLKVKLIERVYKKGEFSQSIYRACNIKSNEGQKRY